MFSTEFRCFRRSSTPVSFGAKKSSSDGKSAQTAKRYKQRQMLQQQPQHHRTRFRNHCRNRLHYWLDKFWDIRREVVEVSVVDPGYNLTPLAGMMMTIEKKMRKAQNPITIETMWRKLKPSLGADR
jgi:hypothetical protein